MLVHAYATSPGNAKCSRPHQQDWEENEFKFHSVTCYTNSMLSRIHVNTTDPCNITCTLVATGVILGSLECTFVLGLGFNAHSVYVLSSYWAQQIVVTRRALNSLANCSKRGDKLAELWFARQIQVPHCPPPPPPPLEHIIRRGGGESWGHLAEGSTRNLCVPMSVQR